MVYKFITTLWTEKIYALCLVLDAPSISRFRVPVDSNYKVKKFEMAALGIFGELYGLNMPFLSNKYRKKRLAEAQVVGQKCDWPMVDPFSRC